MLVSPDITFQFYPVFDSKNPTIVLNSCKNGVWGTEQIVKEAFPFKKGKPFEIFILCDISEWKVKCLDTL